MRTARLLTVSQHALMGGVPAQGGVPAWGCTCPGGVVPAQGGLPDRGCTCWECTCPGGCTCPGVYLPRGVYLPGGVPAWEVYLPRGVPAQVLPAHLWTEWQTGAKILPCPKLRLRAVNIAVNGFDKR